MLFFVELSSSKICATEVTKVSSPLDIPPNQHSSGVFVEVEDDQELLEAKELFCVVDISQMGKNVDLVPFISIQDAKDHFCKIASQKFSNWDEYSSEDISFLMDGDSAFEQTSDGSLSITTSTIPWESACG